MLIIHFLNRRIADLQNHVDGTVSCNSTNSVAASDTQPPSLVSALSNFSERAGSQRYGHVYFNIQVFNTTMLRCN